MIHLIPDSEILKQQSIFLKKNTIWTENDNVQGSLLKMLHEIKAPLYMFDKIMNWAADANTSSYIFSSVFRRRDRLIRDLYDRLDMHGLKPKKINFLYIMGLKIQLLHLISRNHYSPYFMIVL